jgi:hypothetical protein
VKVKQKNKIQMKKFLFLSAIFVSFHCCFSQHFNGTIEFNYVTLKDTVSNIYIVKDQTVKLDQFGKKSGNIEGSFIFNMDAGSIIFVNPKGKVWGDHKSVTTPIIRGKCEVSKGATVKNVLGVKCNEYTVTNTQENTSITYWIAIEKFNFFAPLVKLWNRKDKQSVYFNQIKGLPEGAMPLMSEEKTIDDGKILTRLEVTKIIKKMPEEASVQIPAGYKKFDK